MKTSQLFLTAFVTVSFGQICMLESAFAAQYSLKDLQGIAAGANKTLPVMVDAETRLDAVVASEGRLEKRYTLVSSQTSDALVQSLKTKLFPMLKAESCKNSQSLGLYRSGVSEAFTYSDKNGKLIATYIIGKSSCD
jgi:hypothetical protein